MIKSSIHDFTTKYILTFSSILSSSKFLHIIDDNKKRSNTVSFPFLPFL
jgi:hypothetical protein